MIERVIRASVENRVLVLFGALLLAIAGIVAVLKTPRGCASRPFRRSGHH